MGNKLQHHWTILCEGPADKAFFKKLIRDRKLSNFNIIDAKGRCDFSEKLKALRLLKQDAILIVADNDNNPNQLFSEVQNQIRISNRNGTGYPIPNKPMEVAKVDGQPVIMIMMIPWVDIPGCLETLLLPVLQREKKEIKICVDNFLTCTETAKWEIQKRDKTAIQCFIAGSNSDDPNKSLRYLLESENNPIPMNASEFDDIVNTLTNFETIVAD